MSGTNTNYALYSTVHFMCVRAHVDRANDESNTVGEKYPVVQVLIVAMAVK